MNEHEREEAIEAADEAAEAIRTINHLTLGAIIPAPDLYRMLGKMAAAVERMPQALGQFSVGLERSMGTYQVQQDDGSDPAVATEQAVEHLRHARELADDLGRSLREARAAITFQSAREIASATDEEDRRMH